MNRPSSGASRHLLPAGGAKVRMRYGSPFDLRLKAARLFLHPDLSEASVARLTRAIIEETRRMTFDKTFGAYGALEALVDLGMTADQAARDEAARDEAWER